MYKSKNANADSIIALNVAGDSMEPTLSDKEIILFDKDNRDVKNGGIFIVSTNAGLFVKRVALKTDGSLELISDNKSYNSEHVELEEMESLNLLGRVIGKVALV